MCSFICLLQWRLFMNPALELVGTGPPARALLFVLADRPGAGNAADRAVTRLVVRVVGTLVDGDVRLDAVVVAVRVGVPRPDDVALRAVELRGLGAARV